MRQDPSNNDPQKALWAGWKDAPLSHLGMINLSTSKNADIDLFQGKEFVFMVLSLTTI
jgi:hypothetical protein